MVETHNEKLKEMNPWDNKKSKADLWKRIGKIVYSQEEYKEFIAKGPIKEPKSMNEALEQYYDWPSEETYNKLKTMYESIPHDERRFCLGDQNCKDEPVKNALYGERK